MSKKERKLPGSSFHPFNFLDELGSSSQPSFIKRVLKRYFEDKDFLKSQGELKKEMNHLKNTLKEMDDAIIAHQVMEQTKKRLHSAYHELVEAPDTTKKQIK